MQDKRVDEEAAPPAASHKKAVGPSTSRETGHQSSRDEDMEDKDAHLQHKTHPKNSQHITDDDDIPRPPRPTGKKPKDQKSSKKKAMVIDSSSDDQVSKKGKRNKTVLPSKNAMVIDSSSDDQINKKTRKPITKVLAASLDSDIEEISDPSPEDELGEWYLI
jgi:hypothetical protein